MNQTLKNRLFTRFIFHFTKQNLGKDRQMINLKGLKQNHLSLLFRIGLISLLAPLLLTAQQGKTRLETRFIPHSKITVNSPYLRFDPFTVNDSLISGAFGKELLF